MTSKSETSSGVTTMKKKPSRPPVELIPPERIEKSILLIRGQKVLLDFDLAELYDVATKVLIQSVKRNIERFPDDFMFQLTTEEFENWRSQFVLQVQHSFVILPGDTRLKSVEHRRSQNIQKNTYIH